jgi:hypothetical protein
VSNGYWSERHGRLYETVVYNEVKYGSKTSTVYICLFGLYRHLHHSIVIFIVIFSVIYSVIYIINHTFRQNNQACNVAEMSGCATFFNNLKFICMQND